MNLFKKKTNAKRFQQVSEVVSARLSKLEGDEAKLQVLRGKLQDGEESALVDGFDGKKFISGLHSKHLK